MTPENSNTMQKKSETEIALSPTVTTAEVIQMPLAQSAAPVAPAPAGALPASETLPLVVEPPLEPPVAPPAPEAPAAPATPRKRGTFAKMGFLLSALITGIVAGVALVLGLLSQPAPVLPPPPAAAPVAIAKPPAISVVEAVIGPIEETTIVTGTLVPREEVLVGPQLDGLILNEVLVDVGDVVKKDQVLARLSQSLLKTSLAQNDAQIARAVATIQSAKSSIDENTALLTQAMSSLERTKALRQNGIATTDTLEQRQATALQSQARVQAAKDQVAAAEADKALAEAQRNELLIRLERTEIKAPSDGIISRRTARVGAIVSGQGEPLFRIIENGAIELEANVPETTLAALSPGLKATVTTVGTKTVYPASLRLIEPEVNATTRLGAIRIAIDNAKGLTIGAFGRADITIAKRSGVVVPQSAVLYGPKGAEIQVVKDGIVQTRAASIGLRTDQLAEVTTGVAAGEQVISIAGTFVRNGDRVTPVTTKSTSLPVAATN